MTILQKIGPAIGRPLRWFALLLVVAAAWVCVLWFGFRIDLSSHSFGWLATMHLLPPLGVWLGILGASALHRRQAEAGERRALLQQRAEREIRREAALAAYRAHWMHRHAWIDCRWIGVRDLLHAGDPERLWLPAMPLPDTTLSTTDAPTLRVSASDVSALPWPLAPLTEMLEDLYAQLPAVSRFGILVQGANHQPFADTALLVQTAREAAMQQMHLPPAHGTMPPILSLPPGSIAVESVIDLFHDHPDLPGQVVIAFDSAARAALLRDDDADAPFASLPPQTSGPGQVLALMVLTQSGLDAALQSLEGDAGRQGDGLPDPHVPHWDRMQTSGGLADAVAAWPSDWRPQMAHTAVVAQLCRPAPVEPDAAPPAAAAAQKPARIASWSAALADTVDTALHNAALRTTPFAFEDEAGMQTDASRPAVTCGWVVHDAGPVDAAGQAIAALCVALERHGIAPDPIRESTNVVAEAGDTGTASPWLMLALAGLRAQALAQPVAVVTFGARASSVGFVLPVVADYATAA